MFNMSEGAWRKSQPSTVTGKGEIRRCERRKPVFVLARNGTPLMPCKASRARIVLNKGRAKVHKLYPFTIRLVDRTEGETQPVALKLDPGANVIPRRKRRPTSFWALRFGQHLAAHIVHRPQPHLEKSIQSAAEELEYKTNLSNQRLFWTAVDSDCLYGLLVVYLLQSF